jgi:hypothetical protein|nr:MAG TPA: hypothetical protein [Caudoviricetes sp.]
MDRWTERFTSDGEKAIAIHDGSDFPDACFEGEREYDVMNALADYEDLEEQGLLVRLPCKVGDILFRINKGARNPIIKMKVSHITIKSKSYSIKAIEEDYGEVLFSNNVIGKTVFLTREDAEKKLEEMIK